MKGLIVILLCLFYLNGRAQSTTTEPTLSSMEQMAERNPSESTDNQALDDYLSHCLAHPFDINTIDKESLLSLMLLTDLQIESFLHYRLVMGSLVSLYELQAIPHWDVQTIKKIVPFIRLGNPIFIADGLAALFQKGQHSLQISAYQMLERSIGFRWDTAVSNRYLGSPLSTSFRYKYQYNRRLQFGWLGQKDAGETFFDSKHKWGYDFYSAHFFVRQLGWIQSLAIGDYTINMAQGLIQWQSLAFKKGGNVLASKRASPVIKPYQSFGESNFHRGVGVSMGNQKTSFSVFASWRKLDANLVKDSTNGPKLVISSYQSSGLHRTVAEWADRHVQSQFAYGGSFLFQFFKGEISLNGIHFDWKYPLVKEQTAYNMFALNGNRLSNYSIGYSYTRQNFHFFGETAIASSGWKLATVNGLVASVASKADFHLLYRDLSREYASVQSNAFTEHAAPSNEAGLYAGFSLRPFQTCTLEAYADFFSDHWLRYGQKRPSAGNEYFVKLTFRPSKTLDMYTHLRVNSKEQTDFSEDLSSMSGMPTDRHLNWRTQVTHSFNRFSRFQARVEAVWVHQGDAKPQQGFLLGVDWRHQFPKIPLKWQARLLLFDVDGYDSRIYVFERSSAFNTSAVALYRQGLRYHLQVQLSLFKKLQCSLRFTRTRYLDGQPIGTGLDKLNSPHQSTLGLQCTYDF